MNEQRAEAASVSEQYLWLSGKRFARTPLSRERFRSPFGDWRGDDPRRLPAPPAPAASCSMRRRLRSIPGAAKTPKVSI